MAAMEQQAEEEGRTNKPCSTWQRKKAAESIRLGLTKGTTKGVSQLLAEKGHNIESWSWLSCQWMC